MKPGAPRGSRPASSPLRRGCAGGLPLAGWDGGGGEGEPFLGVLCAYGVWGGTGPTGAPKPAGWQGWGGAARPQEGRELLQLPGLFFGGGGRSGRVKEGEGCLVAGEF